MFELPENLRFASDATELALGAAVFGVFALTALIADRRRMRRKDINNVGWVPWTGVFFTCLLLAATLMTLAVQGWRATG